MGIFDTLFGSSGEDAAAKERGELMSQSQSNLDKALAQWEGIDIPVLEKLKLQLQYPELVGTLEAEQLGPSLLGEITTDPRLKTAQMKALSELQTMSKEGLTPEQEAMFADLQERGFAEQKAKEADIMSSLERRGLVGGEGSAARSEMLMKQQSAQSIANEQASAARKMAAEQAAAMRGATMQAGQLASQMSAEDYQRAASAEQARAAIEAANASNRQNVASQNLTAAQQIANARTNLANQKEMTEQGYNIQIPQQNFANQTTLAGAKAGALTGQAGLYAQQANNVKPQQSSGLMPVLGALGGAAAGYALTGGSPMGAKVGSDVGLLGGATLSKGAQSKADGGVIENSKPTQGNQKQVYADKPQESDLKRLMKLIGAVDKYANGNIVKPELVNSILDSVKVDGQTYTPFEGTLNYTPMNETPTSFVSGLLEQAKPNMSVGKPATTERSAAEKILAAREAAKKNAEMENLSPDERDQLFDAAEASVDSNTITTEAPTKKGLSDKDIANYAGMAGSIIKGITGLKPQAYDDGWRAPVINAKDFAPQSVSVAAPIKMEYGGVVPGMKSMTSDRPAGNGNSYTPNGMIEDIRTAYGSGGMSTDESSYFKRRAAESYTSLKASPVGNINNVNSWNMQQNAAFADGGIPKKKLSAAAQDDLLNMIQKLDRTEAYVPSEAMAPMKKLVTGKNVADIERTAGKKVADAVMDSGKRRALVDLLTNSKVRKYGKVATKAGKAIPGLGALIGLGSALATGDASAAVPVLNEAESLGPKQGSLEYKLESGERMTPEEMEMLKSQYACGGRVKHYEDGGRPVEGYDSDVDSELIDGTSYVGDRVDAKVNSGEMVLNVDQQQRLMELLRREISPEEMPAEDVVRPASEEETNLHEKNQELEARLSAIEGLLKKGI